MFSMEWQFAASCASWHMSFRGVPMLVSSACEFSKHPTWTYLSASKQANSSFHFLFHYPNITPM